MPYGYLANQGLWGDTAENVGNAFNNSIVGLARLRFQQQQAAQQAAMDRAYLDLAVRQAATQKPLIEAQTGEARARTGELQGKTGLDVMQKNASEDLGFNLRQSQMAQGMSPDIQQLIQGYIMKNQGQLAGLNPANIASQTAMIQQSADPRARQMLAFGQPMIEKVPAGGQLFDVMNQTNIDTNPKLSLDQERMQRMRVLAEVVKSLTGKYDEELPGRDAAQTELSGMFQQPQQPTPQTPTTQGGRVKVKAPDGSTGTIPAEQVDAAKAEGYIILGQ